MATTATTSTQEQITDKMKMTIRGSGWLVAVLLAFSVAGCATNNIPAGRYQAFSVASENVQSVLSDTYTRIEKRQRDFAVLASPDEPLTEDTFKLTVNGKSYDLAPQLQAREAALDVLINYAKTLETLAVGNSSIDVDKSVQNLAASLKGLPDSGAEGAAANIFASLVDNLALSATNTMRKDGLKSAMTTAQPAVESISTLLQRDNGKIARTVNLMRDRYIAHAQSARPSFGSWQRYKFDSEVAAVIEEFQQINDALVSSSAAIQKLPDAHRQILESLDNKERPLDALRDMINEAKRLRTFYRALPTN